MIANKCNYCKDPGSIQSGYNYCPYCGRKLVTGVNVPTINDIDIIGKPVYVFRKFKYPDGKRGCYIVQSPWELERDTDEIAVEEWIGTKSQIVKLGHTVFETREEAEAKLQYIKEMKKDASKTR